MEEGRRGAGTNAAARCFGRQRRGTRTRRRRGRRDDRPDRRRNISRGMAWRGFLPDDDA
jgi:hypothetical protein